MYLEQKVAALDEALCNAEMRILHLERALVDLIKVVNNNTKISKKVMKHVDLVTKTIPNQTKGVR
jgi:hypothetical protein